MNYYQLWQADTDRGNPMLCVSNLKVLRINVSELQCCNKIEMPNEEIVYSPDAIELDGNPEDILRNCDFLPIFSEKVITILNKNGITEIQYIPITVKDFNGKVYEGYYIANILTALSDAIDKGMSMLQYQGRGKHKKIEYVWHYAIKGEKAAGHDIFRLRFDDDFEKEFNNDIFVSERFRKIIKENHFTGATFSKITTV